MKEVLSIITGAARAEFIQLRRSPLLIFLVAVQAITFLLLVSIFGLTGSRAPTAIITNDTGPYGPSFIQTLQETHHSFALQTMDANTAEKALKHGDIVAAITLPSNFSSELTLGHTVPIQVAIDNLDTDLTDDIQRALPSALVAFAKKNKLSGIPVHVTEIDLINYDTGFIPYLVVSALALDAFIIAGTLSAMAISQEFESNMMKEITSSPAHPLYVFLGRLLVTDTISFFVLLISTGIVIVGYGVSPLHPIVLMLSLLLSVIIFGFVGMMLGILIKRTLPVASLIFGLALPLYMDSGSLEPERFDGNTIWMLAHLSPIYSSVGILEYAFHGLLVTPESITKNIITLIEWALCMLIISIIVLHKRFSQA